MNLKQLVEKCEAATEGSRELDALIECELRRQQAYALGLSDKARSHWDPIGDKGEVIDTQGITRYHPPTYTFSLDAALVLVPEELAPTAFIQTSVPAKAGFEKDGTFTYFEAATPALALCIAALKARAQGVRP